MKKILLMMVLIVWAAACTSTDKSNSERMSREESGELFKESQAVEGESWWIADEEYEYEYTEDMDQ